MESPDVKFKNTEIVLLKLALGIVLLFSILDIGYDIHTESPAIHIVVDVALTCILLFALSILLNRNKQTHSRVAKLQADFFQSQTQVEQSRILAEQSQLQVEATIQDKMQLLRGLGECIDAQLGKWNLSVAEKDIALLLLKGLSHREIAEIRNTSERTVRQQSLSIYSKAGLKGRSDLSAFFLEDMLAPLGPQRSSMGPQNRVISTAKDL